MSQTTGPVPPSTEEVSLIPYKSDKQRKYMHAKHPEIAKRWDKETGGKVSKPKKGKK